MTQSESSQPAAERYSAAEIEQAVSDLEGIRVVIRSGRNDHKYVKPDDFKRRAANNSTVSEWIDLRLEPILQGAEVEVVRGDGSIAPRQTTLDTVRKSYIQ